MPAGSTDMSQEAEALIEAMQREGLVVPQPGNIEQYRNDVRSESEPDVKRAIENFRGKIEDIELSGVPCKQVTPDGWPADSGRCILYAYGGGFVSGSPHEDLVITLPLAQQSTARIVMVDYRLSPEHPYPEPQQDMRQVYQALLQQLDAGRLVVSGESAGGNQALGLLHHIRDSGLGMPRCAVLFSPWCDLANRGDSHDFNDARDPTLNQAWVDSAARMHANGYALEDPGISPLLGDMRGLPPCLITTGSRDLLLSQCLRLARALRAAGVKCDLRVWEGLWHVFEFYPIPEAAQSIDEVAQFIIAH